MFCGEWTAAKYNGETIRAGMLRCRSWQCEECMPRRLQELKKLAASGNPTKFLTLTCDPAKFGSKDAAAKRCVEAWRLVRQQAKREGYADRIEYLAVFEAHKSGWPHLHILARAPYIPQAWLSERMEKYSGGRVVWISSVKSKRHAARYVAKYVSKGPAKYFTTKRYFRSMQYAPAADGTVAPVHDSRRGWITETDVHLLRYEITRAGWDIVEESPAFFEARPGHGATWIGPRDPPDESWPTLGHWWRQPCLSE